ncbi:MAG: hypothetical protein ACOYED_08190 [Peptococcia bacterium]|jgi:adenylyl- and sulfurtransferase ThiI
MIQTSWRSILLLSTGISPVPGSPIMRKGRKTLLSKVIFRMATL